MFEVGRLPVQDTGGGSPSGPPFSAERHQEFLDTAPQSVVTALGVGHSGMSSWTLKRSTQGVEASPKLFYTDTMSLLTAKELHCDGCGEWMCLKTGALTHEWPQLRREGWTRDQSKHWCPRCGKHGTHENHPTEP